MHFTLLLAVAQWLRGRTLADAWLGVATLQEMPHSNTLNMALTTLTSSLALES